MLRWTVHLEGGPRRVNHAAVAVGHRVYSFGGYCSGEDYETLRQIDVHIFNAGKLMLGPSLGTHIGEGNRSLNQVWWWYLWPKGTGERISGLGKGGQPGRELSRAEQNCAHSVLALDKAAPSEACHPWAGSCGTLHAVWTLNRPHRRHGLPLGRAE